MRGLLIPALAFCSGCYSYAPIAPEAVPPGTVVRARVTSDASDRLSAFLGAPVGRELNGTLHSASPDSLVMEVPSVADVSSPGSLRTLYQRVTVARRDVLELETRTLDRMRTGAIATVAAVVAGAVLAKALRGEPGIDRPPGGGGPAEARTPSPVAPIR
jgi:hypothetical protein